MNPMAVAPVIPVVIIDDLAHAVPLARALQDGGIGTIEVTLRSPAALPAIERIATEVPDMVVGAGTLRTPQQVADAHSAGAQFLVSPGTTANLLDALSHTGLPYLPGISTVSEVLTVLERGITHMKFFPAETSGGLEALRSFAGPLSEVVFCPTGGITADSAADYLALSNVDCVGGSWLTPAELLRNRDWAGVRRRASEAAALKTPK